MKAGIRGDIERLEQCKVAERGRDFPRQIVGPEVEIGEGRAIPDKWGNGSRNRVIAQIQIG